MNNRTEFAAVEAYVRDSAIVRSIEAFGDAWRAAVEDSSVARRFGRRRNQFVALPAAARVRGVAVAVTYGSFGYLLLLAFVPGQVAPSVPPMLWWLVLATATFTAIVADRLAESWGSSSFRRLWSAIGRASR